MNNKYFILILFFQYIITYSQINFVDVASSLNINGTTGNTYLGNGISFVDFNNDGWDDLSINTGSGTNIKFFQNNQGQFTLVNFNLGPLSYQTKQINWVDIDNDGDKDLFITSDTNGNRLFENLGGMNFQNISVASGMNVMNMESYGASWGDYNNDGFLDVFISNRSLTFSNKLYKNNGDNTFTDVTVSAGISTSGNMSFCSAFLDINNDGLQDIYVSNDKYGFPNLLYKNNGNNTFTDISISSQSNVSIDAMSVTVDDFNNDGLQDIYITNTQNGNVLLKNNGDETFTDIASSSGTLFNSIGWGASFFDADNDMDLDLYVSGEFDDSVPIFLSAAFYLNNNDETFSLKNESFENDTRKSYSNAIGDFDNNGLTDIVVSNINFENIFLWQNESVVPNNWLKVNLEGTLSNKDGIGSTIEISIENQKQYRYTHCGEGYLSQNSNTEFFGLGENTFVDYVKVTWLSGNQDIFYNVDANQVLNIEEGSSPVLDLNQVENTIFKIFPNPVKDLITIESLDTINRIEFFTVNGRKINFEYNNSFNSIDVSFLKSGCYIMKLYKGTNIYYKKIIKI
jgi:hypothetical protein